MRIQRSPLSCRSCGHWWVADLPVECDPDVWIAAIKSSRCPECSANYKNISMGRANVPDPEPDMRPMSELDRRANWLRLWDSGISSEVIANVMAGVSFDLSCIGHPHDGADFGRCHRLLTLYPMWRERLDLMRGVSPQWDALVSRWDDITKTYLADRASKDGTTCYRLMREVLGDG